MGTSKTVAEVRQALVKVITASAEWREYIASEHPRGKYDPRNFEAADGQKELAEYVRHLANDDAVLIAIAQALGDGDLALLDDDGGAGAEGAMDYSSCHGLLARYSWGRTEDPVRFLAKYAGAVARAAEALQDAGTAGTAGPLPAMHDERLLRHPRRARECHR